MFRLALTLVALFAHTAAASSVAWGSASRSGSLVKGQDGGNLVVTFTPSQTVPNSGTVTITPSENIFTANTATTCTATSGGVSKQVQGSATVGAALTVTMHSGATLPNGAAAVITCTSNLAVNGNAGAVTFTIKTNTDTDALTSQTGYTKLVDSVAWTSASRSGSLVKGQSGGNLVVTFTPQVEVPNNGIVTITPSANIFTADAGTTCTATSGGTAKTVASSATVGAVLKVTMHSGATLPAAAAVVITCTSNLAVNGAAGAVTFGISTSVDTTALTGQTGYTKLSATASASNSTTANSTTAAPNSTTAASGAAASTSYTQVTQKLEFPSLTVATYTGNTKGNIECAYTNTVEKGAATTTPTWCTMTTTSPFRTYKTGISITSSVARRAAAVTFTLKVDTSVMTSATLKTTVAANSNAANFDAKLAAVNSGTNLNITSPGTPTVHAATFKSVGSGASNLLPSMLGLVSALFIAFKHM